MPEGSRFAAHTDIREKEMKRRIAALVFIVMVLSLFGCLHPIDPLKPEGEDTYSSESSSHFSESSFSEQSSSVPEVISSLRPEDKSSEITPPDPSLKELKKGDKGEEVLRMQERLKEMNWLFGEADGEYGTRTEEAVFRFQKHNGLEETGSADVYTLDLLYSDRAEKYLPLKGLKIGIDPGHQKKGNYEKEPVAPGSETMKTKVSSGTAGVVSRVPEYKVVLIVGLRLKELLENFGATVIMTREVNEVDLSNIDRAKIFNEAETDYAIRLHCNGSEDPTMYGVSVLIPKTHAMKDECRKAAEYLLASFCDVTKERNRGIKERREQTGFNWCERMIINIEMGYMSNEEDDLKLTDSEYQEKMCWGILYGIVSYFENSN
jgi:N-acetylmuramoyl-L-alanine amidase